MEPINSKENWKNAQIPTINMSLQQEKNSQNANLNLLKEQNKVKKTNSSKNPNYMKSSKILFFPNGEEVTDPSFLKGQNVCLRTRNLIGRVNKCFRSKNFHISIPTQKKMKLGP